MAFEHYGMIRKKVNEYKKKREKDIIIFFYTVSQIQIVFDI